MKKDDEKVVDLSAYRQEKQLEAEFFDDLLGMSDEELDDLYDDLAFGEGNDNFSTAFEDIRRLEELERLGRDEWLQSQPLGWRNEAERSYLATRMELASLYKQNGLYQKALNHFMAIYQMDESDVLGCRYEIMSLYVLKSDFIMAEVFYRSCEEYESDVIMQVLLMIIAILEGRDTFANDIIEDLCAKQHEFIDFCQLRRFPLLKVVEIGNQEQHLSDSMDNLLLGFYYVLPLLMTSHQYIQAYLNDFFDMNDIYLEDIDLPWGKVILFNEYGIARLEDFKEWTEAEILAFPGVGKRTIQKLKEAGVIFKEE